MVRNKHDPRRRVRARNVAEVGYSSDPEIHRVQLESDLADLIARGWVEYVPELDTSSGSQSKTPNGFAPG